MEENRRCIICDGEFIAKQKNSVCCSGHCRHKRRKIEKLKNSTGDIECKICGARFNDKIVSHINAMHNLSLQEYQTQTGATKDECFSKKYLNIPNMGFQKGEKNPAWKHRGRLSPWSKKSHFYSEESQQKAINNRSYQTKLDYWIGKGYSLEEAKIKHSARQRTFSKAICIQKHGEEKGLKIFQERQDKWQSTLSNKPPEEKARINKAKMSSGYSISKGETELFLQLKIKFDVESQVTIGGKIFDIVDTKNKKVIEYNGVFWHCKPGVYNEDYINPVNKRSALEIWKKDKIKEDILLKNNYKLLIIWEDEYNENKKTEFKKCERFLS